MNHSWLVKVTSLFVRQFPCLLEHLFHGCDRFRRYQVPNRGPDVGRPLNFFHAGFQPRQLLRAPGFRIRHPTTVGDYEENLAILLSLQEKPAFLPLDYYCIDFRICWDVVVLLVSAGICERKKKSFDRFGNIHNLGN